VISRSRESAERTIAAFAPGAGDRVSSLEADLGDENSAQAALADALRRFGRIDAVLSLAGGGGRFAMIADSTAADLTESVHNNLVVAYNLFVPALRAMLATAPRPGARSRGRLVAVTAGSSLEPQPRFGLMGVGKAGVNVLMRAIAREHKDHGIVANAIVLGTVATEAARAYLDAASFAAAATPEEVADILVFHASDRSTGVNGELIPLNAREVD
jgi:NAD(P)-dependent dehydrogenase (short-subunit alcohol dehydrogenase family)